MDISNLNNWRGANEAIKSALSMLRPPDDLTPSQWAEKNLKIPEGNKVPGLYRVRNAPIQREPMDLLIDPECRRITLMWSAQTGKTMCALAMQGYCIAHRPQSQMMMQPTQGDVTTWLETKFNPMIEASDTLKKLVTKPRSREGVNNQKMKSYPGGFIMFSWASSTETMRSRSAPKIFCDEAEAYSVTEEGHPVSLIWQRAATFGDDRFLVEISTPTIKDASYIEQAFLSGDQRYFHVLCPDCGESQVLQWSNVTWRGRRSTELHDAEKDLETDDHDLKTAAYVCEHCGSLWDDGKRLNAIRTAEENGAGWKPSKPFKGHASYHAWEAYSTFRRLRDIVQDYLERLRVEDLQSFANVSLSRTYELKGDGCDPESLYNCRHEFPDHLPDGVLYITLGADMQMDRLEYEIVGWGFHGESWSLEYGIIWGDPLDGQVFSDLEEIILESRFTKESGKTLKISASALDTGGTTGYPQAAWDWLRGKTGRRIFGIKGYPNSWGRMIVSSPQRQKSGKNRRRVDIYPVAVDEAKIVVYRRIRQTVNASQIGGPGFMHVPESRAEEWFKQLTSEKLVPCNNTAYQRKWVLPSKVRNEALDCRVYAYAALHIMKPSSLFRKSSLAASTATKKQTEEETDKNLSPPVVAPQREVNDTHPAKPPHSKTWRVLNSRKWTPKRNGFRR